MDIKIRTKETLAELKIESGNVKITEDMAIYDGGKWVIPEGDIEQFIVIANECSRFNGKSDVAFVKLIFDAFLSDAEKLEFIEIIKTPNQ